MNYIIIIGAFQALVVLCLFFLFPKEKQHNQTLNWLLASVFLHLGGNFIMNTVFPYSETHKQFITFIALIYAPLLRVYAGQLAGSRAILDRRTFLLFLPALAASVVYFTIGGYTILHHGKTPPIIGIYNSVIGYAILLSFPIYSIQAIRLSVQIPYFWKTERKLVRLVAVVFLILFIVCAVFPHLAGNVIPADAVKWILQITFYVALLVVCLSIGWVRLLSLKYVNTVVPISPDLYKPGNLPLVFHFNETDEITASENQDTQLEHQMVAISAVTSQHVEKFSKPYGGAAQPRSRYNSKTSDKHFESHSVARKQVLSVVQQQNIAEKIGSLMQQQNVFTDSSLTLDSLANRIAIPRHHLSEVLNIYIGKSFYQYLNEYRIHYVTEIMHQQTKNGIAPNILSLAFEAGFHSKSSFNQYFKKTMASTPSEYLRSITK